MSSNNSDSKLTTPKIRVPGADEPKNALEVFKTQFENFSKFIFHNTLQKSSWEVIFQIQMSRY